MRTTYLHIGTHKTGTTSIQAAMDRGRERLKERGFLYPLSGRPDGINGRHGHHGLSHDLNAGPANLAECRKVQEVLAEIKSWDRDVIISAERLNCAAHHREKFAAFIDQLQELTPRVVIVLFLRDVAEYKAGIYLELAKWGHAASERQFFEEADREGAVTFEGMRFDFDYDRLIRTLPTGPGIEIVTRYFDRERSVVADICTVLGTSAEELGIEELRENRSGTIEEWARLYRERYEFAGAYKHALAARDAHALEAARLANEVNRYADAYAQAQAKADALLAEVERLAAAVSGYADAYGQAEAKAGAHQAESERLAAAVRLYADAYGSAMAELEREREGRAAACADLAAVTASRSWRMTAPLRRIVAWVRR